MNIKGKKIAKLVFWIFVTVVVLPVISIGIFLNNVRFGKLPEGGRLARIEQSPNYLNGKFQNRLPTKLAASEKPKIQSLHEFVFRKAKDLIPEIELPPVQMELKSLNLQKDVFVWTGHKTTHRLKNESSGNNCL